MTEKKLTFGVNLDLAGFDKGVSDVKNKLKELERAQETLGRSKNTLQGEGAHTGRPAVFVRFSGCNLWSGREEDRHNAICKFCDTDFHGTDGTRGGKYLAYEIGRLCI